MAVNNYCKICSVKLCTYRESHKPHALCFVMLCAKPKAYGQVGEPSHTVGLLAGHGVAILKSDWLKQQFHSHLEI